MLKESEVITFGCRLNIYESEIMKQNLESNLSKGFAVFNSCAVTQESIKQIKTAIKRKKKENPEMKIIVTGCAAQIEPGSFLEMDEVDQVVGNSEKRDISSSLRNNNSEIVSDIMVNKDPLNSLTSGYKNRTRAFVEIQNGCNHRCTFCIIPFGRGNLRSKSKKDIISEIHNLINDGHKEIILTGVDIASWGNDINDELSLSNLVRKILNEIPKLERLRLSSMDVIGFDESLINLIAENPKIMPHIHLSLQSGDNMILKRMKRRHSREDAISLCKELKLARPEITFGADLIVGFPTETDEMFQNTLKIVDDCNLDWIHAFPFSPRPGTPAARMPQIERHIIKERSKTLRETAHKRKEMHLSNLIGSKVKVFMEKQNKGHTNQFAPVKFIEEEIKHGQTVDALIVDADKECAYALAI